MSIEYQALMGDQKNLKLIAAMAKERVQQAHSSKVEKAKRVKIYKTNQLMSLSINDSEKLHRYRFVPPIFQTAVRTWIAFVMGAFRVDPIINIVAKGRTPPEAAKGMQKITSWNSEESKHMVPFSMTVSDAIQHGTGILKHVWEYRPVFKPVPVLGPAGEVLTRYAETMNGNDYTYRVNPENYIQDDNALGNGLLEDKCRWCGEILRFDTLDLNGLLEKNGVIQEALQKAIKLTLDENKTSSAFYSRPTISDNPDSQKGSVVAYELYGRWPIKGNENDRFVYEVIYCEETDEVLCIQPKINHPYTLIRPLLKNNAYIGSSPCESCVPTNLIITTMINTGIENMMAAMKRYVFYLKGSGIKNAMQEAPNNGFIPIDLQATGVQQVSQAVQQFQGSDVNVQSMQAYLAYFNDLTQRSTSQSDLFSYGIKPSTGGGLNHAGYTAAGANVVDQNNKTSISFIMNNIAMAHESHWDKKILEMQEVMPDDQVFEISGMDPALFRGTVTLGNFKADAVSGIITNKNQTLQAVINLFPFMQNLMTAAASIGQGVNMDLTQLMKEVSELADLPNLARVFPEQPIQPAIPQMAPAQTQGVPQ